MTQLAAVQHRQPLRHLQHDRLHLARRQRARPVQSRGE
jgi:hypothetical protein